MATQGATVGSGALVAPGGAQGPGGLAANAWTLTSANFTVPPVGSTAVVNVNDTSWAVTGEFVWVATAGGSPSSPMALQISAKTPTSLTLLNPPTAGMQASGNTGNLLTVGTDSLLYLPPSAIQPVIWSSRLRSLNILGNPTMEIDQANCGTAVAVSGTQIRIVDRWTFEAAGTHTYSCQQQAGNVAVPGTSSFYITQNFLRATLTTQEPALGATHYADLSQNIEGPAFREVLGDVFSVSVLCRSSIANLQFGVCIVTNDGIHALGKWCTLGAANTWTLVQLPNLPSPASSGGTFSLAPGAAAAYLYIGLAEGTGTQVPANDAWITNSPAWTGWTAKGTYTFSAGPLNSTFDIAYVQMESGSQASTLIDKPFTQNLDECIRYYQKTYSYAVRPGTVDFSGAMTLLPGSGSSLGPIRFVKRMAKTPTVVGYSPQTGAATAVYDNNGGVDRPINGIAGVGETGFNYWGVTGQVPAVGQCSFAHYTADTYL